MKKSEFSVKFSTRENRFLLSNWRSSTIQYQTYSKKNISKKLLIKMLKLKRNY